MLLPSLYRLLAAWNNLLLHSLEAKGQFGHLLVSFEQVPVELRREVLAIYCFYCRQQETFHLHPMEICKFKVHEE